MSVNKPSESRLKAAVSVSEMAKLLGLSRASLYALIKKGVFLAPIYSPVNKRPLYTADMQAENLAARQGGIGVNGEYVLFYEKRQPAPAVPTKGQPAKRDERASLMEGLSALGLDKVTTTQVGEAIAANFPNGIAGVEESVVLRVLNRHFRRLGLA